MSPALVFLLLSLVGSIPAPQADADSPYPWEQVHEAEGLSVFVRQVPGSSVREMRAERIIDAPAQRVWQVVNDLEGYTEFMPYVVEARRVGRDDACSFEYLRLDPPLAKARDYTLCVGQTVDPAAGTFVRHWRTANQQGPAPRRDSVRLDLCNGSWTVTKLGSRSTHVAYWLHTDPGGALPAWVVNQANRRGLPDLMAALYRRVRDPSLGKR